MVEDNLKNYGREVARMQDDIDKMLAHYHDNDIEVLTILNNTVTLHEHMKRTLVRNEKALNKPYFGSEAIANDDLLTKYLAKNKQTVLSEIVATIQKEQNEIIRKSPYH